MMSTETNGDSIVNRFEMPMAMVASIALTYTITIGNTAVASMITLEQFIQEQINSNGIRFLRDIPISQQQMIVQTIAILARNALEYPENWF